MRLIRVRLVLVNLNSINDTYIPKGGYVRILVDCRKKALVKQESELLRALLHLWSRTEGGQLRAAVGFFTKAMVRPRTRADHGHSRGN